MKAEKGKKYKVLEDREGNFKSGDVVVALENDSIPYCVHESNYIEGKNDISDYDESQINLMDLDKELEPIESAPTAGKQEEHSDNSSTVE